MWGRGTVQWQKYDHVFIRLLGSEDNWAEGNLVLWPPVSRQQRLLHLAKAEQEGEEKVCVSALHLLMA